MVSLTDSGHPGTMQNNFSALVIILLANNYSYDMEEGARHEKI
jgi:hypothetical protein